MKNLTSGDWQEGKLVADVRSMCGALGPVGPCWLTFGGPGRGTWCGFSDALLFFDCDSSAGRGPRFGREDPGIGG